MAERRLEIKLKTLTPLWTGGVETGKMDRIHETGIIGSLRWWYEAIVRGLGNYACDPVDDKRRCIFDTEAYERARRGREPGQLALENGLAQVCPACRLFGCTGWSRKIRLDVQGNSDAGQQLRFLIQELKPMETAERWLFIKTIWLIATYGALGGRTPWKPQKSARVGQDYGLIELLNLPEVSGDLLQVQQWMTEHSPHDRRNLPEWPDLRHFFFVQGAFLQRKQINQLIGKSEDGRQDIYHGLLEKALRGSRGQGQRPTVSKKVFSFQTNGGRLWGYLPNQELLQKAIQRLIELGIPADKIRTGQEVLNVF